MKPELDPNSVALGSAIRHYRLLRGLTLEQLGAMAELSTAMISKVELGSGNPSITSLRQIAHALNVPVTLFFAHEVSEHADQGVLVNKRHEYEFKGARYTVFKSPVSNETKFFRVQIAVGASLGTPERMHEPHEGFEQGYIVAGVLTFTVGGAVYRLSPGDSIAYPSTLRHSWVNEGPDEVDAYWVVTASPSRVDL